MAVDDKEWIASTTDWNTVGNWSGAAIPTDDDNVHFTGTSQQNVAGITPGAAGDALTGINVHEDFTGSIGSSGSKLILASVTTVRFAGRGSKLFLDATVTNIVLSAQMAVTDFAEFDGTITAVHVAGCSGSFKITSGAALTNVDMHDSPHCTMTIESSVTALDTIRMTSGRLVNSSAVSAGSSLIIVGGNARYEHELGAVGTVLVLGPRGRYVDHSAGNITTVICAAGGIFDGRQNVNAWDGKTITNVYAYPGAGGVYLNNALNSYTVTNRYPYGGVIQTELGVA